MVYEKLFSLQVTLWSFRDCQLHRIIIFLCVAITMAHSWLVSYHENVLSQSQLPIDVTRRLCHPPRSIVSYRCRCDVLRRIVDDRLAVLLIRFRWIVAFSIGETRIGIVNRRILAVLSVVLGLVAGPSDAVAGQCRWSHVYPRADRFKAAPGRAILDLAHASSIIHETVFTVNLAVWIFRLDFV